MSTRRPSSSSRSTSNPPGNHGGVRGPASISKSRSLSSLASPRAKEPNTRTRWTPCLAAMARIAARLSLPNSSRVMHTDSRTSGSLNLPLFPQKHAIQFPRDSFGHGRERAHGMAVDDGFGGGFQNFQAVESLQNVAPGDQHAIVLQQGGGAARRHLGGQRFGVTELQSVGKASNLADHDVAFRDGAGVQRYAGNAERGSVHRVGVDDGADGGMLPVDLLVQARGTAGDAAGFAIAVAHHHQLVNVHGAAVLPVGRDQEAFAVQARREAALRADE